MYGNENESLRQGAALRNQMVGGATGPSYANCEQAAQTKDRAFRNTPLRERIARAKYEGERAIERYQAAERAQQILDQHPEFAELLDLVGQF